MKDRPNGTLDPKIGLRADSAPQQSRKRGDERPRAKRAEGTTGCRAAPPQASRRTFFSRKKPLPPALWKAKTRPEWPGFYVWWSVSESDSRKQVLLGLDLLGCDPLPAGVARPVIPDRQNPVPPALAERGPPLDFRQRLPVGADIGLPVGREGGRPIQGPVGVLVVIRATNEFWDKTTRPNERWQTGFTYLIPAIPLREWS